MVSTSLELVSTALTLGQWNRLRERLVRDYPLSYIIMRSVMQRELGFTVRRHAHWIQNRDNLGYYRDCVYLDWYNGAKKTFFMLKYSEYIQDDS